MIREKGKPKAGPDMGWLTTQKPDIMSSNSGCAVSMIRPLREERNASRQPTNLSHEAGGIIRTVRGFVGSKVSLRQEGQLEAQREGASHAMEKPEDREHSQQNWLNSGRGRRDNMELDYKETLDTFTTAKKKRQPTFERDYVEGRLVKGTLGDTFGVLASSGVPPASMVHGHASVPCLVNLDHQTKPSKMIAFSRPIIVLGKCDSVVDHDQPSFEAGKMKRAEPTDRPWGSDHPKHTESGFS
ncbi:hypothetical protein BGW80DRAFT_1488687 [Lactifluus volemus]|nr:hypothetical protein BGW80DRAFT_1488687 [Lactifluus volemus]